VSFIPAADESDNENESAPERVTAVGVHAGEGVKDGRAVWVWRGDEGSRAPVSLPFPVHSVHAVRGGWPLLAVGTNGALAAISSSLQTTSLLQPRPKAVRVLAAGVVDAHAALAPRAVIVDDRGRAYVYALEASSVNAVAEGALAGPQLLAADVGPDGTISVIDATHRVHARTVASIVESATSSTSAAPAGVLLTHAATPAAIISLPSASRPLAAIATAHPSPAVALALPSPDLPAVLASVPISTAASTAITHLSVLSRNEADNTLVLGTVLAHPDQAADGAGRSVIHLVDVALPAGGVGLSLLVGSAARTAAVFKVGGAVHQNAGDRMVEAVAAALRASDAARAEKAFATWLEGEDKAAAGRQALIPESVGRKTLQAVFAAALTDGKKTGPYATKIVQTLVDRRAVTDSMWDGGVLLAGLVPAGDWVS
jgi:hypothetical protein